VTVDDPGDIVVLVTIGAAILAGLLWLIRAQVSLLKEFRPNGGSTTRDALNRIESDVRDLRTRLDNHMDNHGGRS
jgi:hypothetical protein